MKLSRGLYVSLIVICTDLILVSAAALVLLPTGSLSTLPLGILAFLLAWKMVIAVIIVNIVARWTWSDDLVWFGGYYNGRIVGLLTGGIIGGKYGGTIGAIALAIGLYLIGARFGKWISLALHTQGRRLGLAPEPAEAARVVSSPRLASWLYWWPYAHAIGIPVFFVLVAVAYNHVEVPALSTGEQYLPWARLVVIVLSLYSFFAVWAMLRRSTTAVPEHPDLHRIRYVAIGLAAASAVAAYGLILFMGFGSSLTEAILFALASAAAGLWWIGRFEKPTSREPTV